MDYRLNLFRTHRILLAVAMKGHPKISVCQHIPLKGHDLEQNFQLVSQLIRQAASEGTDLAVLPEYSLAIPHNEHDEWADSDYSFLKRYQELAKELNINLVPGTISEVCTSRYNMTIFGQEVY